MGRPKRYGTAPGKTRSSQHGHLAQSGRGANPPSGNPRGPILGRRPLSALRRFARSPLGNLRRSTALPLLRVPTDLQRPNRHSSRVHQEAPPLESASWLHATWLEPSQNGHPPGHPRIHGVPVAPSHPRRPAPTRHFTDAPRRSDRARWRASGTPSRLPRHGSTRGNDLGRARRPWPDLGRRTRAAPGRPSRVSSHLLREAWPLRTRRDTCAAHGRPLRICVGRCGASRALCRSLAGGFRVRSPPRPLDRPVPRRRRQVSAKLSWLA